MNLFDNRIAHRLAVGIAAASLITTSAARAVTALSA